MSVSRIHELAIAAQKAHVHASGASFAADRGAIESWESESAYEAARLRAAELAEALAAFARDAPAEHERLLSQLRQPLATRGPEDLQTTARVSAWLDAGAPPEHRDAAWVIVWRLGVKE